jgi:hypothetical protein
LGAAPCEACADLRDRSSSGSDASESPRERFAGKAHLSRGLGDADLINDAAELRCLVGRECRVHA